MRKTRNQASTVQFDGLAITFSVNPVFRAHNDLLADVETDLLLLELHAHKHLGGGPKRIDTILGGALTEAISSRGFTGELGQTLLLEVPQHKIKNVLVVGAGTDNGTGRSILCATIALLIETARRLDAQKVTLPVFPGGLEHSLMGTMAILQCRLRQIQLVEKDLGSLRELEILSTPQAKNRLLEGLSNTDRLCPTCSHPQLHTKTL